MDAPITDQRMESIDLEARFRLIACRNDEIYAQVSESAFFDSDTLYDGLLEGIRVSEALTPTPGSPSMHHFSG